MRIFGVISFLAVFITAGHSNEPNKAAEKLQGTWRIVSAEQNGKQADPKTFSKVKLVVTGDKMLVKAGDITFGESTFVVDSTKKPPTIDITTKGNTVLGIYSLDGDSLKTCVNISPTNKERPTEFTTTPDSKLKLTVYMRDKQ